MHIIQHGKQPISSPDRLATAKELTKAMETVGFVYLDSVPGFNKEVEENLHKAASWVFFPCHWMRNRGVSLA